MNPAGRVAGKVVLAVLVCAVSAGAEAKESRFLVPAAGDVLASGVTHEVRWATPCLSPSAADEMEVLLSVDGGRTFSVRVTAELPACATGFRWKVPDISTDEARLAVRVGRDGHAESEEIAFVSPPFRITAFAAAEDARPGRAMPERWTEQALHEIGAEDRLGGALRGSRERLEASASEDDLDETAFGALPTLGVAARGEAVLPEFRSCSMAPLRSRRSVPLPLRE